MTEEIVIDRINVWSCKHYDIENNYCDQSYLGEGGLLKNTKNPKRCEQSPNCYYKQLQRLKQENEKLRYKIQEVVQVNDRIVAESAEIMKPKCETSMISELMKENEKLKEKIEAFKTMATVPTRMYNECERERCRYRRTLEEIRVIAEKYKDMEGCRIPLGAIKMTVDEVLNVKH